MNPRSIYRGIVLVAATGTLSWNASALGFWADWIVITAGQERYPMADVPVPTVTHAAGVLSVEFDVVPHEAIWLIETDRKLRKETFSLRHPLSEIGTYLECIGASERSLCGPPPVELQRAISLSLGVSSDSEDDSPGFAFIDTRATAIPSHQYIYTGYSQPTSDGGLRVFYDVNSYLEPVVYE